MTNDELQRLFGLRVQALRRRRGLTQEELAEAIERSVDTVSNVERGQSTPRLETAAAIADALGVALPELFEFGAASMSGDRDRRRMIEELVALVGDKDETTIQAITDIVRVVLNLSQGRERG